MKKIAFIFVLAIFILGCKNSKKSIQNTSNYYTLADSNATANALLKDDAEGFFTKIQAVDVAIQLKDNSYINDAAYLAKYRTFLKTQATNFSEADKKFLTEVNDEAIALIKKVNPNIIPNFQVCKIKTGHYGDDVYYTRGNAIFLPENIFIDPKKEVQLPVMLHEIWHIMSEANPKMKSELYKLIGFVKHNTHLKYPPALKKMLLTNPDGAHDDYAIKLAGNKLALATIVSGKEKFDASDPAFFKYLRFELFGIDANGNVEANPDLSSKLTSEQQASFFENIKDNTQYIIHADEIIADNFMLAVLANNSGDYSKFSAAGKKLIMDVLGVLKKG